MEQTITVNSDKSYSYELSFKPICIGLKRSDARAEFGIIQITMEFNSTNVVDDIDSEISWESGVALSDYIRTFNGIVLYDDTSQSDIELFLTLEKIFMLTYSKKVSIEYFITIIRARIEQYLIKSGKNIQLNHISFKKLNWG